MPIRTRPIMPEYDVQWVMKRYGVPKVEAQQMVREAVRRARKRAGWESLEHVERAGDGQP